MLIAIYIDNVSNEIDNSMQRGVMRSIAAELKQYHQIKFIDPVQNGRAKAYAMLQSEAYDLLLTYNKTGTDLAFTDPRGQQHSLLASLRKPHVAWLTEHPVTFFEQYLQSEARRHYVFAHDFHAAFAMAAGFKGSYTSQSFGSTPQASVPSTKERPFDVCIAAQWRGTGDNNEVWKQGNQGARAFFEEILELQEEEPNRDSYQAFMMVAKARQLPIDDIKKYGAIIRNLYWYARKIERINLVKELSKTQLRILLVGGTEWKQVLPDTQNITFAPPCSHQNLLDWYKKSKVVATMNNYNGANERIYDALNCGAGVFCESAPRLLNELQTERVAFYRPNRTNEAIEALENLVNTSSFESIRLSQSLGQKHTWGTRVATLRKTLESVHQASTAASS